MNRFNFTNYNDFEEKLNLVSTAKSYYSILPKNLDSYTLLLFDTKSELIKYFDEYEYKKNNTLILSGSIKYETSSDNVIVMFVDKDKIEIDEIVLGGVINA